MVPMLIPLKQFDGTRRVPLGGIISDQITARNSQQ
jgi:hypothetical protein